MGHGIFLISTVHPSTQVDLEKRSRLAVIPWGPVGNLSSQRQGF